LLSAATQDGDDVVITLDSQSAVTLRDYTLAELETANVTFAPFVGTPGNDVLDGSNANDVISGLAGDDVINGNGGSDSLFGGSGNDTLNGGADSDYLAGESGNDILDGGASFDTLEGGAGDDSLTGGADTDWFQIVGGGHDTITDFANDVLSLTTIPAMTSRAALNLVAAEVGLDVVITIDANNTITLENFTLAQLAAADVRFAPFIGTEGNDVMGGSPGDDVMFGLGGDDVMTGDEGFDQLFGGAGNDTLNGGAGGDALTPGTGNDTVDGGESLNDYIDFGNTPTHAVNLAAGTATDDGTGGVDLISNIEHVYASSFNDMVAGDAGSNSLHGFAGNDTLLGRAGNDNLYGYDGDDTLNGGTGVDFLNGMGGDDLFVFAAGDGLDMINDFTAGAGSDDVIDLQAFAGFNTFADVQAATANDGFGNAVINLGGGDQIMLQGVGLAALHADDFLL